MAEFPALPFWTDAYLADTRNLNTLQHGAYLLLLIEAWRRPGTCLPDDDSTLARLAGLTAAEWQIQRPVIMAFWRLDRRSKTWIQKRLTKEKKFVKNHSNKQSLKAKSRWNKEKHISPGNAPTPTPTPTKEIYKESLGGKEKNGQIFVLEGSQGWVAWKAYRNGRLSATEKRQAKGQPLRGWYFPSEFPPAKKEERK